MFEFIHLFLHCYSITNPLKNVIKFTNISKIGEFPNTLFAHKIIGVGQCIQYEWRPTPYNLSLFII